MFVGYEKATTMSPGSLLVHAYGAATSVASDASDASEAKDLLRGFRDRLVRETSFIRSFNRPPRFRGASSLALSASGTVGLSSLVNETLLTVATEAEIDGSAFGKFVDEFVAEIDSVLATGSEVAAWRVDGFLAAAADVAIEWTPDSGLQAAGIG